MKSDPSAAEAALRRAGLRRTPVRVGVIQLLARGGRPLSVPQILGKLRGVDSVTVYRTLGTFARKGLVHRVRGEDRGWMYALGPGRRGDGDADGATQHRHPHFVCAVCGKVECLDGAEIPRGFVHSLGAGAGYAVTYCEVVLHGRCPRCAD